MEDKQMAPDSDWELVDKPGPPGEQPDAVEPPVSPQPAPAAPESPARNPKHAEPEPPGLLEEIAAKGLFCLLCVVEAAVKMTAHATQMVRRAGMASAHLAHKLAAAARPALQGVQMAGAACAAALRHGDYSGAVKLAGRHASEAAACLAAALAPVLATMRDSVHTTATRWRAARPTCRCLPTAAQLRERQQRLLASTKSSVAEAGKWASAKWSAIDLTGRVAGGWKRARASRSSTYVLVVVGLGCASLAVSVLLLTSGPGLTFE